MSSQLIAHLMSFQSRMKDDHRTSVMFEGDYDTISDAIAYIRRNEFQPLIALEKKGRDKEKFLSDARRSFMSKHWLCTGINSHYGVECFVAGVEYAVNSAGETVSV